jgi:two-component system sensor histidine kinase ChvG
LRSLEQRREHESSMAADLVHELKNPLAAIRAAGEALQKPSMDPVRRAQLGRVLEASSARLMALVTEYLEMARAEARLPGEVREPVDLGALVRGVAESFREDERFSKLRIDVVGLESAPVHGIPHRLESVVRNLLENSACVSLPDGKVEVALIERGPEYALSFTDSGPGIPESALPELFNRFISKKTDGTGTGLGLALSRAIVEAHGGVLTGENAAGGGAIFRIVFPRA